MVCDFDLEVRCQVTELYLDGSSPTVIPLQISGSIDCDLSNVTANELMRWGLANL